MDAITSLWIAVAILAVLLLWIGSALAWSLRAAKADLLAVIDELSTTNHKLAAARKDNEDLSARLRANVTDILKQFEGVQAQVSRFLQQLRTVNETCADAANLGRQKFDGFVNEINAVTADLQQQITSITDTCVTREQAAAANDRYSAVFHQHAKKLEVHGSMVNSFQRQIDELNTKTEGLQQLQPANDPPPKTRKLRAKK